MSKLSKGDRLSLQEVLSNFWLILKVEFFFRAQDGDPWRSGHPLEGGEHDEPDLRDLRFARAALIHLLEAQRRGKMFTESP